jgi:uncharacterized protein (DUF2267 family)
MQTTRVDALDRTVQKTNEWLEAIGREMGAADRRDAYHALRAVLHALRDRLPLKEIVQLAAQLPLLVRGIYYEGWTAADSPYPARTRDEFLGSVFVHAGGTNLDTVVAVRAVFQVLAEHVSRGEIEDVRGSLPPAIRELWPRG